MDAIYKRTPSLHVIRSPETKHTDGEVRELVPVGLEAAGRALARFGSLIALSRH
jgi:hypothetical protein